MRINELYLDTVYVATTEENMNVVSLEMYLNGTFYGCQNTKFEC